MNFTPFGTESSIIEPVLKKTSYIKQISAKKFLQIDTEISIEEIGSFQDIVHDGLLKPSYCFFQKMLTD